MDIIMEDIIEWFKRRKPAELVIIAGVVIAIVTGAIVALVHFAKASSSAGPETSNSMTCGKFTGMSRDEQIEVIRQTPGYMDKVPSVLGKVAGTIAYNCKAYPAGTPINDPNIMY